MKKILKQGSISKKWITHCFTCDTEFEYEAEDLHYNSYIHRSCVSCPCCGSEIVHRKDNNCSNITIEHI